jgi:hypothetical protein
MVSEDSRGRLPRLATMTDQAGAKRVRVSRKSRINPAGSIGFAGIYRYIISGGAACGKLKER